MVVMTVLYAVVGISFLWLVVLTVLILKLKKHYNGLIGHTGKKTLDSILDGIISEDKRFEQEIHALKKELGELSSKSHFHFQKVGLVRFNPFERMGGEQSFILSFLDGKNNGIILNFLYTKEGVRVYSKRISEGKSDDYELSKEEKEALINAK